MKYVACLLVVLLSGCVTHEHADSYQPYLLIWDDGYSVRTLGMHSLAECINTGHNVGAARFKCVPENNSRVAYNSIQSRVNIGARVNIR